MRLRGTSAPTKNGGEPPSHRLALPERRERHDGSAAHGGENDEDEGPENRGMALCLVVERREEGWEIRRTGALGLACSSKCAGEGEVGRYKREHGQLRE